MIVTRGYGEQQLLITRGYGIVSLPVMLPTPRPKAEVPRVGWILPARLPVKIPEKALDDWLERLRDDDEALVILD